MIYLMDIWKLYSSESLTLFPSIYVCVSLFVQRNWLDRMDHQYNSFAEYQQRMVIFKENYIQVQKMNEVFGYI